MRHREEVARGSPEVREAGATTTILANKNGKFAGLTGCVPLPLFHVNGCHLLSWT